MRVELHKEADQGLGGILTLKPGLNDVDPALWAKAAKHSLTPWFLEQGIIRVLDDAAVPVAGIKPAQGSYVVELPDEDEAEPELEVSPPKDLAEDAPADKAPAPSLVGMNATQAIAEVAKIDSVDVLMGLLEDESRKSVIKAIEARVDLLSKS